MAIAINGSGTITGISQGGLNDNIITKNEMATGGAWAPAGTVLQVVTSTSTTTFTSTASTFVNTGISVTYTPISATSKIVVQFIGAIWLSGVSGYSAVRLINTGGNTSTIITYSDLAAYSHTCVPMPFTTSFTSGTTSAITTTAWINPNGRSGSMWLNNDSTLNSPDIKSSFTIWEIAA